MEKDENAEGEDKTQDMREGDKQANGESRGRTSGDGVLDRSRRWSPSLQIRFDS